MEQNTSEKKISLNVARDNVSTIEYLSQQSKSITEFANNLFRCYRNYPNSPVFDLVNKNLGVKLVELPDNVKEIEIDVFTDKENIFSLEHTIYHGKGLLLYQKNYNDSSEEYNYIENVDYKYSRYPECLNTILIFKSFEEDNSKIIYLDLELYSSGDFYQIKNAIFKKVSSFVELGNVLKEIDKESLFEKKDVMKMMSNYDGNIKKINDRLDKYFYTIKWNNSIHKDFLAQSISAY